MTSLDTDCCDDGHTPVLDEEEALDLATIGKALSDPTRVRLLSFIAASPDSTVCACHVLDDVNITQPTLSFHMKKLHQAGLVDRERRGKWVHYSLRPGSFAALEHFMALLCSHQKQTTDGATP